MELPLVYTMSVDPKMTGICLAKCKILLSTKNCPEWLVTTIFSILYTQTKDENTNIVSVIPDNGTTNRYYEMMLSIVSSYIKLKEDIAGVINQQCRDQERSVLS
eukprot:TRINITY_DN67341_c0_g1_i1.p2 TRINITY_DN67341_c0_g1~~TRINITY_DN67341_c0_g1_i1.p2  ORF type:complete len:113 (+),score=11.48 TRINITY_DN67341_c0_g1_i1:29-340(+)